MKLKLLKILLFLILALFTVYIGFLLVIKNYFKVDELRGKINEEISTKIAEYNEHYLFSKRNVKFNVRGNISLLVFPRLNLVINDVILENVQYRDLLLQGNIKKVEIKLNFRSFLKKKIKFENIIVSNAVLNIENNELPDFYITKKITKKVVKLEDNEVFGVKDKLKNILMGNEISTLEDGYKEIEVEEDTRVDLDNKKLKTMLVDLFNTTKRENFIIKNNLDVDFSGLLIGIVNNDNIEKEFKHVNGNLNLNVIEKEMKLRLDFVLNNINGNLKLNTKDNIKEDTGDFEADLTLTNNQNDKILLKYNGNNLFTTPFKDINGSFDVNIDSTNFNNLIQWVLPASSPLYYKFDYKKPFKYSSIIDKEQGILSLKNIRLDAEDLDIKGEVEVGKNHKNINFDIEKLDLNNFIVNVTKSKNIVNQDNILIFKYDNFEEFLKNIPKSESNKDKKSDIKINIKNLVKGNEILKDSVLDFEVSNNNFKIRDVRINFNDFVFTVSNQQNFENYYYSNFEVKGSNFKDVARVFDAENMVEIKDFNLNSKIFVYNDTIYLYDISISSNGKTDITGALEYSLNKDFNYLAGKILMNNVKIETQKKKHSTLKEKFLWLNNFSKEVFLDLTVNNLTYNGLDNIYFKSRMQYNTGFLNVYKIDSIKLRNIENIQGRVYLDVRGKSPKMDINLFFDDINYEINLIDYIFDLEKYKSILFNNTEVNKEKQEKYWIYKLFSFPNWNEICGNINLKCKSLKLNDIMFSNISLNTKIEDGVLNVNSLNFLGLGGSTELKGEIDLKNTRNINLVLTDTIYNIQDIFKLLFPKLKQNMLSGTIGIGGIFKAVGFNPEVFMSSMNLQAKFVGQNLFVKKLGLMELKNKLGEVYTNHELLNSFKANSYILNNSGTTFDNYSGSLILANGINNFVLEAQGRDISNKLNSVIDNSTKNIMINIVNTSAINLKVGKNKVPFYVVISFKEDFANKANLLINTNQIDEYVNKIRATQKKNRK